MSNPSLISRGCTLLDKTTETECFNGGCNKLNVFNWLKDYPKSSTSSDFVEVRFKNTRKWYYKNVNNLSLKVGDVVAVEASPGHDIGVVSLMGELVYQQMRKTNFPMNSELKKIYRKAKPVDIEKWIASIQMEQQVMLKAREISQRLKLEMKIDDVEYQGDTTKAIFYYIADERVDFRELIKVLAEEFKIRVEMRQIGARQEAGRIGGIGSCGRELCCSTWITSFVSVTTNSARFQELSLNPQKLAGQCGKLKCCLNYELDTYVDARNGFPEITQPLITIDGKLFHQKTDIFKKIMWFSFEPDSPSSFISLPVDRVKDIIEINKAGKVANNYKPAEEKDKPQKPVGFADVVEQENINRFIEDKEKAKRKKHKKHFPQKPKDENKN